ncbi:MAG TPA: adenine phosphoribosyltransferase [Chloroflexota bacterium]|jgi:adenine phosphoribosyltransferase|nr:adenine phosphoribosyltransferase [Chloroflexota bacterium]
MPDIVEQLRAKVREVADFPQEGILFYDITTVLKDAGAFKDAIDLMTEPWRDTQIDVIAAMESRGFIFGAPMAYLLGAGFVPIRKPGKLPSLSISKEYTLEYGTNVLEMHRDAVEPGQRVLLVDDVLATGGTIETSIDIVRELGGVPVGVVVLIELDFLNGRERLKSHGVDIQSFVRY